MISRIFDLMRRFEIQNYLRCCCCCCFSVTRESYSLEMNETLSRKVLFSEVNFLCYYKINF